MKKKMWLSLTLSALLLTAAGCGSKPDAGTPSTGSGGDTEKKQFKIAISQYVEHPSLDATREGIMAALKDGGISEPDTLKLDYNNAQNDSTNNLSIGQKLKDSKNDLIIAIATPSAQVITDKVKETPVLFAAVTDPLDAKLVSDLEKPGGNVSGASDTNPDATKQLMKFISTHFSNVKKVGLIINEGEPNAVVMSKTAEEALKEHGIELVKAAVTNTSEVKQAAESLVGKVDAFYITLDNNVVSGADTIIQTAKANKIPFFASDRDTVEKGAFATVGFKYYDHGYQVGQMAVEILKNGKKPADMKITIPDKLDLILNAKAAADYGIEVTDAMKQEVKDPDNNIIQ
ncbi:putative ABC transport system substrate-binding protein [Paenibacillus uliginis N3/975]|uniref:Putative ABC transport system substrate-binding protein n=1 Tax=Paenibacillus uliginis N3/975 TaxID=1313296 RepID=A0A1X7H9R7_9BACL|nr:ABC transporter substrate-binding protein [Paenibacillus uliginis]SMF82351.1 putative ABC transport system substrate-binding protein [Paenibacillus uliginis N3/975]